MKKILNHFKRLQCVFMIVLLAVFVAGCGSDGVNHWDEVNHSDEAEKNPTLIFIDVTPADPVIVAGLSRQFTATGIYSDGTSSDITGDVTWASATPNDATINDDGLAIGVRTGTPLITATLGDLTGSTTLNVSAATLSSIVVTPNATVASGLTRQLMATGIDSEGVSHDITSLATWTSATTGVATVNAAGIATGIAAGTSTITAEFANRTASTTFTVTAATLRSIVVTPTNPSVANGLRRQLVATGIYSDGTSDDITASATWSSSATRIAIVNAAGNATGVAAGTSVITADLAGKTGNATITVTAATLSGIAVTPLNPSVANGLARQFTATGTYTDGSVADISASVIWSSGTIGVAVMNPNGAAGSGRATGIAAGTSVITAALAGKAGSTTLHVTPATLSTIAVTPIDPNVAIGLTRQFAATGTYSDDSVADITASVTWSSGTIGVATLNPNGFAGSGLATGISAGTSTITAALAGKTDSTMLTVRAATLDSIVVTPVDPSVTSGLIRQFTATGTYSDATTENITASVIWSSGDTAVATMNPNGFASSGRATGFAAGTSVITATSGSESGNTTLTVTEALANNPTPPELGATERFVILASAAITTTSGSAIVGGDLGIIDLVRSSYAGFTAGAIAGEFDELSDGVSFAPDDTTPPYVVPVPYASTVAFINQVRTDLGIAYTFLAADPNPGAATQVSPVELGNLTLTRGVYKTASNVTIQTGNLTLDAQDDPDSVWIFSIGGTLATGAPGGSIVLINGAQAKNVYWRTAGTTVIEANTDFAGNVFAWPQINVRTGAVVTGRLFSVTEQVTLQSNAVTAP